MLLNKKQTFYEINIDKYRSLDLPYNFMYMWNCTEDFLLYTGVWHPGITDEGAVSICGTDKEKMEEAAKMIHIIVTDYEAGQIFEGKVTSIKEFGAFVEFAPGKEGMVHISKISKERINKVEDVLNIGDVVKVVCMGKDKMGRFSFSMRDVAE